MNWDKLKTEQCPRCSAFLKRSDYYHCIFCNFKISFGKAYGITGKIISLEKQADILIENKSRRGQSARNV